MLRILPLAAIVTGTGLALLAGCGQTDFPADLGPTLEQVNRIRNSETLDPQEKRDALTDLGLDPVTINGLLIAEGLANQFGGTLTSAFEKVNDGRLTELTPDEVQIYADATDVTGYGDVEARSIVEFFNDVGINTLEELVSYLDTPGAAVPDDINESDLRAVFDEAVLSLVWSQLP